MHVYEIVEGAMLFCFSIGWHFLIYRMLRTGRVVGKSTSFVVLICVGYLLGVTAKLFQWEQSGVLSGLVWVYAWNAVVTAVDLVLVIYYTRRQARSGFA